MLINETDFKEALPIGANFEFEKLNPDIKRTQDKYIKPILGVDMESILDAAYEGDTLTEDQQLLVDKIQPALAHLSLWLFLPKGNVYVGDNGLQSTHSDDSKPAFEWQVKELENSLRDNGFDALDELIAYLELVADTDFPDWLTSEGCTLVRENFINTAKRFTLYVPKMRGSRYLFSYVKPIIARLEKKLVQAITGKDLYDELKTEIADDDLSAANLLIMEMIEPAVAHAAWANALYELGIQVDHEGVHLLNTSFSGTVKGKQAAETDRIRVIRGHHLTESNASLRELQEYLVANVDTYPLFENGETYDSEDTDPQFENEEDSGIVGLL